LVIERRVRLVGECWFAEHIWQAFANEAVALVQAYHAQYPLRSGLSKEEWRARLHLSSKVASDMFVVLENEKRLEAVDTDADRRKAQSLRVVEQTGIMRQTGIVGRTGVSIRIPGFVPCFTPIQQQHVEHLFRILVEQPYMPPGRAEVE